MTAPENQRPRARVAEARRNRQNLIAAASRAFAGDRPVPLEAIAADAGVGIGTLYRHFPTREALVEAVYEDQVERLADTATELLGSHPPREAFRLWMNEFIDWAQTKHGMIETLRAVISSGRLNESAMRAQLVSVVQRFLAAGTVAGDLRADADPADIAALLAGVLLVAGAPAERAQAERMLDLIVDSLRV